MYKILISVSIILKYNLFSTLESEQSYSLYRSEAAKTKYSISVKFWIITL